MNVLNPLDIIIIILGVVAVLIYGTIEIIKTIQEKKGIRKKKGKNIDEDVIDNE